jgi:beta-N-acetylhexosaminidase
MGGFDPTALSIDEKIGQLFFIGLPGPDLDANTVKLLETVRPGGVCLFARNIKEAEQTRKLLDRIRDSLEIEPLLSLDQEGGRVDRLRRILTPMPAASQLRELEHARELGSIIADAISLLGFNMNFAPVVDVASSSRGHLVNGLQTRGFGSTEKEVVAYAGAFLDSLSEKGIIGCLKHFPGLAAAQVDSHEELPMIPVDRVELDSTDLFPYREMLGRPSASVMVAHATYPNADLQEVDANGKLLPSSLDPRIVTSLLRDELRFTGVAITDDMEMGAVVRNYGIGEACKMAIMAGEDMLAICASQEAINEAHRAVTEAVNAGEISEPRIDESIRRIAELKGKISEPSAFDKDELAEIDERIKRLTQHLN